MKKPLPISKRFNRCKFTCENLRCLHVIEKNQFTDKGILIGCICPKCGWHMVADPVK